MPKFLRQLVTLASLGIASDCIPLIGPAQSEPTPVYDVVLRIFNLHCEGMPDVEELKSFVEGLEAVLPTAPRQPEFHIYTKEGDDEAELKGWFPRHEIRTANLESFCQSLNQIMGELTPHNRPVLFVSVGVKGLSTDRVAEGLRVIEQDNGVEAYGWSFEEFANKGEEPGMLWYNTAAILSPNLVRTVAERKLPSWIDNGTLGFLDLDKQIPIGGGEETVMMAQALQANPNATFALSVSPPLSLNVQVATGIDFATKIERKKGTAQAYLSKLHFSDQSLLNAVQEY